MILPQYVFSEFLFSLSARFCVGVFFSKSLAFTKVTAGRSDGYLYSGWIMSPKTARTC